MWWYVIYNIMMVYFQMKLCRRFILFDKIWTVEIKAREPHDHSPPHHCAYLSRPAVHCTPLAHAADRWRSVCTMTDAPAQSRLWLRRSHVHPVPRVTPQSAPLCSRLKIDFHLAPLAHGCCTFRARLAHLLCKHPNRLRCPSMKPNVHTMTARWL